MGQGDPAPMTINVEMNLTVQAQGGNEEDLRVKFQEMLAEGADMLERRLSEFASDSRRRSYS